MTKRINLDEFTVTFENEPCEQALFNYYTILFNFLIDKFGIEPVMMAIENLLNYKGIKKKSQYKSRIIGIAAHYRIL